jgi:tRNA-splicing ligase RtcB
MSKLKLRGKDLRAIGYPEGPVISIAMNIMEKHYKHEKEEIVMNLLRKILASPVEYADDAVLGLIAQQLMPKPAPEGAEISLNKTGIQFNVFGQEHIEDGAMNQMYQAAKLPVAVAGALMPDAHAGYGLPIGGGRQFDQSTPHEVIDRKEFDEIPLLKSLQGRAARQLGSSGSGNHFAEFGIVEIDEEDPILGLGPGNYLGLLSHSGSRALGAGIANHYTKIAKQKRRLPGEANNLAWLELTEQEGIEYWIAMNLAGDYASACHQVIHDKITRQLGRRPLTRVENHHNFAWKEMCEGREVIVHRKGATPAAQDTLGIIPGSMTAAGFIVKGRGETASIASAAHGAGRKLSRTAAMKSISHELLKATLQAHGVKLLGGGLDEAPQAYKNIDEVMRSQRQLVDVVGKFTPRIVRMDG